jgi:hypothetical protein
MWLSAMADILRPVTLPPPLAAAVWRALQGHPGIPGPEVPKIAAAMALIEAATAPEAPPGDSVERECAAAAELPRDLGVAGALLKL